MRKRIFSLILTCVVFCTCVFGSVTVANAAWADSLDYADLDYSVKFGTDFNTVTYSIPKENYMITAKEYFTGTQKKAIGKDTLEFSISEGSAYDIHVYPALTYGLSLENMPVGTKLHLEVEIDESDVVSSGEGVWGVYQFFRYMNKNDGWIKDGKSDPTLLSWNDNTRIYKYGLDYVIEDIAGAVCFVPGVKFENYTAADGSTLRVRIVDAYVEMEVSTDFWSQFQDQQNGKMLGEIKESIDTSTDEITGAIDDSTDKITGTLDDQWNADIEGSSPDGSDIVENADKVESEIRDEAQAGLDKGAEIQQEASNILKSDNIAQALLCSVKIFETFANIPFFTNLLVVSVSLGIFALLVNLANSFASWHRGNVREAQREQRRQEAAERYSRKHR